MTPENKIEKGHGLRVLITGGSGFLGARLARALLERERIAGTLIANILLLDLQAPDSRLQADTRVRFVAGDLLQECKQGKASGFDVVFHLAAAVSGECENDFDLGMRSNFDTTRTLLETLRASGTSPRLIFASSVAVFGAEPSLPSPPVVRDNTLPVPQTSYGVQKFMCEQMVADYTRKGFMDGRSLRLATVAVRPGRPNAAASGFFSGIIREPLRGETAVCPVELETRVALASPDRTIDALIAIAEVDRESLGGRTAINMPSLSVSVGEMLHVLERLGGEDARARVELRYDPKIARMVCSWPSVFESERAQRLGLKPDPDFDSIVQQFIEQEAGSRLGAAPKRSR